MSEHVKSVARQVTVDKKLHEACSSTTLRRAMLIRWLAVAPQGFQHRTADELLSLAGAL